MAYDENFYVNEVMMDLSADSMYRLLWISRDGEECWWITLDGSKGFRKGLHSMTWIPGKSRGD